MAGDLRKLCNERCAPGRNRTDTRTLLGGQPLPLGYGGLRDRIPAVDITLIAPVVYDNFGPPYILDLLFLVNECGA